MIDQLDEFKKKDGGNDPAVRQPLNDKMKFKKPAEFANTLLRNYEDNYVKKFAFERARFNQCIPNP